MTKKTEPENISRTRRAFRAVVNFVAHQFSLHAKIELFGDQGALARTQRFALFVIETVRAIIRHQTFTLASALTFKSLLSIVPLMMIGMAVSMTLGTENGVSYADAFLNAVEDRIPQVPALKPLLELLRNIAARPREIAGLGFLMLFYTAYSLLSSVEWCFNYIWQVENQRPLVNRLSSYFIIVIAAPVLMSLSVYANSQIASFVNTATNQIGDWGHSLFKKVPDAEFTVTAAVREGALAIASSLISCFTLAILIKLMPFTKVKWKPALLGGLGGGALIEITRYCFGLYTAHAGANLARLYGSTLLFIPLTLLWMWVSWAFVLLGAEIAFAAQNYHDLAIRTKISKGGLHYRVYLAIRMLAIIGANFLRGEKPRAQIDEIAQKLRVAPFVMRTLATEMIALGLLRETADGEECYVPGKDLSELTLAEVVDVVQRDKLVIPPMPDDDSRKELAAKFARVADANQRELGTISVRDFIRQCKNETAHEIETEKKHPPAKSHRHAAH